jgi:hypothetical protein
MTARERKYNSEREATQPLKAVYQTCQTKPFKDSPIKAITGQPLKLTACVPLFGGI